MNNDRILELFQNLLDDGEKISNVDDCNAEFELDYELADAMRQCINIIKGIEYCKSKKNDLKRDFYDPYYDGYKSCLVDLESQIK